MVDLPLSVSPTDGIEYSNVMVVTDRLTKWRYYIPCVSMDARSVARLFLRFIFSRHGLPDFVVSDRGPQFTSIFWKELCECLKVGRKLSTAFHPETDGQSENSNQIMEQYLRTYCNYLQTDWVEWLPLAEFAANSHTSETTKMSPFQANYGIEPRFGVELPTKGVTSASSSDVHAAKDFAKQMMTLHEQLRHEMTLAQAHYEKHASGRAPSPNYQIGDIVWLNAKNLRSERPSKKLDWKNLGPFKVIEVVNP